MNPRTDGNTIVAFVVFPLEDDKDEDFKERRPIQIDEKEEDNEGINILFERCAIRTVYILL